MSNERKCSECDNVITGHKNKLTCSSKCASVRHIKQIREMNEKRKAERKGEWRKKTCEICKTEFIVTKKRGGHVKYCEKVQCKEEGQHRAIERQRQKREAAKQLKRELVTGKKEETPATSTIVDIFS